MSSRSEFQFGDVLTPGVANPFDNEADVLRGIKDHDPNVSGKSRLFRGHSIPAHAPVGAIHPEGNFGGRVGAFYIQTDGENAGLFVKIIEVANTADPEVPPDSVGWFLIAGTPL